MIDKNIPIPRGPGIGALLAEMLPKLEVGDSFICPIVTNIKSTRAHISSRKKVIAPNITLTTRQEDHEGEKALRVWRTK